MLAATFGLFQALMPLVGWVAGNGLHALVSALDHWVAFVLLVLVGGKMMYEAGGAAHREESRRQLTAPALLALAVATSIDALAAGVGLAFLVASIVLPVTIIGTTTFLVSVGGVFLGDRCGRFFERKVERVGGLVLIGIGVNIVIDHEFGGLAHLF